MPDPDKLLRGFHLHQGLELAGWRLDELSLEHVPIVQYQKYHYPTIMYWSRIDSHDSTNSLITALRDYLTPRVITSDYGNPYEFNYVDYKQQRYSSEEVLISTLGICTRIPKRH